MKKKILNSTIIACVVCVLATVSARAEETFIDCSIPNEQCKALYESSESFMPTALNQIANGNEDLDDVIIVDQNGPIDTEMPTPIARASTEPLAISAPYTPTVSNPQDPTATPVVSKPYTPSAPVVEYSVQDVPNGSIITEKQVTTTKNEDGSIVEVSKTKETAISPRYVALPSISDVQRGEKVAYGENSHDWQAQKEDTLRTLLMDWGEQSGWTVVWQLERDYILEAGVVFRGTFVEVASAIVRAFARATPAPVAKFFKGNRVLLITTQEDDNAQ